MLLCVEMKCHYPSIYLTSIGRHGEKGRWKRQRARAANFCTYYASGLHYFYLHFCTAIAKQKIAACHMLRRSSGDSAFTLLEGKMDGKNEQARHAQMWINDIRRWTKLDNYKKIKRAAEDRLSHLGISPRVAFQGSVSGLIRTSP